VTFAHPWALLAAAGAAALVIALHFIARRRPPTVPFPTARFIPVRSVRAPSRSTRPADLPLLLLRVLALLLLGAAFARPTLDGERRSLARVVALDVSASGSSAREARDSAARYLRAGDLLVVFDSAARLITGDARDSLAVLDTTAMEATHARGSLSAALVAAARTASALGAHADSVELVLVSPLADEEWDAATGAIRSLWPGGARLVRTERTRDSSPVGIEATSAKPASTLDDDPVLVVVETLHDSSARAGARIVRGTPSAADSGWAGGAGRVLVHWPVAAPETWPRRERADTIGAVVAGGAVLVADFARTVAPPGGGRVVARWMDGAPAAVERPLGEGCVREVAIDLPSRGDLALSESARRLVRAMSAPCGGARDLDSLAEARLALLRGGDGGTGGGRPPVRSGEREAGREMPWLLAAAALLLLLELPLRRASAAGEVEGSA